MRPFNTYFQLLLIITCSFFLGNVNGQLNLKIGYQLNYANANINNQILSDYNTQNPWLLKEFKGLNLLNGLNLGLRYKMDFFAVQAGWERVFQNREAYGINPSNANVTQKLKYSINRYVFGLEFYLRYFGFGISQILEQNQISSPLSGFEANEKISNDTNFANRLYFIVPFEGRKNLSFALQPFIQVPWTTTNYFSLNEHLSNPSTLSTYNQINFHFGLNLVFYNGRQ